VKTTRKTQEDVGDRSPGTYIYYGPGYIFWREMERKAMEK